MLRAWDRIPQTGSGYGSLITGEVSASENSSPTANPHHILRRLIVPPIPPTPAESVSVSSESPSGPPAEARMSRLLAWAVHAFTMSGLVFATLAVLSMVHNEIGWMWVWASLAMLATIHPRREFAWMWFWLLVALVVDGVDGTCARRARVKEVIPWFDGSVVDIVIDYLTWTFIPALFMYLWVPMGPKPVASTLLVVILVSAMFCYANEGEKSNDNYFVGFPAAWNIVAVMVWVLQTPAWINIAATILMTILTLVPTHYVHPVRVKRFRALNVTAVGVWIAATAWLLVVHPVRPQVAAVLSVGSGLWLVGVGVLRSVQGEAPQSPQSSQSSEASAKP